MIDNYMKFLFVVLCFIIALGSYWFRHSKRDWGYLNIAMGFTVVSDYLLLIAHNNLAGVFTFCFVHIAYILRVTRNKERSLSLIAASICGGAISLSLFTFVPALHRIDPLIVVGLVYASLFIQNLVAHIQYFRNDGSNRWIMLLGLILFALCDIHVLMFNLHQFIIVPPEIGIWGRMWIWVFYAPSQVLLSISAVRWKVNDPIH